MAKKRSWTGPALGYLLAAGGLAWVLHDVHPGRLWEYAAAISWPWMVLAMGCDVLSYVIQGLRWRLLLGHLGPTSVWRTTQAIYAGLFVNEVLPMRLGEPLRAFLVARWLPTSVVAVIPGMVVERLFDAVWIAAGLGITAIFVPLPERLLQAGDLLGLAVLAATVVGFLLVYRAGRGERPPASGRLARRLDAALSRLAEGFRSIGVSPSLHLSFLLSLGIVVFQGLAFWLVMLGCGLHLSPWIGMAVWLVVHLGTALPNAPANVGSYQFFCVVGLTLFGVEKNLATAFSLIVFTILTVPLWVLGFWALSHTGMTLASVRQEIEQLRNRWER